MGWGRAIVQGLDGKVGLLYHWAEWKRESLSLWSLGIYKYTLIVKFTSFLHGCTLSPFFLFTGWFWKKYKDGKVFNCVHLASDFLTWSETLNFNDNIRNLEAIFWPFCLSFLFWKCRDILAGLASPGVMWFSDISRDIFSSDTWHWQVWERRGRRLSLKQGLTAKLASTKWHLQQVFCGAGVRKGFLLYF